METQLVTITSGRGPAECCRVVALVLKQLLTEIREAGIHYQIIDEQAGEQAATYESVTLAVSAPKLDQLRNDWNGTIQWIGNSPYRKFHKRKNWFVAVVFRNEESIREADLNELKIQSMRSGGKGGQHVNKVSTAIRITHLSSGISVTSSEQRSQMQNKKAALQKMMLKLKTLQLEEAGKRAGADWKDKIQIQRGNPIRVFRATEQQVPTDKTSNSFGKRMRDLKRKLNIELNDLRL